MSESLRVALLLDPLSLSLVGPGLRVKWASHAPELAREFLGRGHHVRGFGAPAGLIPRSSNEPGSEDERLAVFRRVRDAIAARLRGWVGERIPA